MVLDGTAAYNVENIITHNSLVWSPVWQLAYSCHKTIGRQTSPYFILTCGIAPSIRMYRIVLHYIRMYRAVHIFISLVCFSREKKKFLLLSFSFGKNENVFFAAGGNFEFAGFDFSSVI